MATKRIKDISTTATTFAADDFIALDASSVGTRKMAKASLITQVGANYLEKADNLSDVASKDTSKLNLEVPNVGTAANEVSVNGMLNSGAWVDWDAFYEEGTWTPVISFGGGTAGILYSAQDGLYIKTGKQVTVHGSITLSNKGTSNGSMRIAGLPYTSITTTGSYQSAVIGLSANWDASVTETPALVVQSASTQLLGTVALSGSELQDTHFGNTTTIRFSATYQIA